MAGWVNNILLCQNKFAVPGDPQVVLLLLVHDDDLAVALKQVIAFDARLFAGRRGNARCGGSFGNEIHKCFSHQIA